MALVLFTSTEFKNHVGLTTSNHDAFIAALVGRMLPMVENWLGRKLEDTGSDVTEYYDGSGTSEFWVRRYPIYSVTSLHVDQNRAWGTNTEITSGEYVTDDDAGLIRMLPQTVLSLTSRYVFTSGISNVRVVYRGGYKSDIGSPVGTSVPADLREGALLWAEALFNKRAAMGVSSMSVASANFTFTPEMPGDAVRVLSPYKAPLRYTGFNL